MPLRIGLKKVILTAIARNFHLWSEPVRDALLLTHLYRFDYIPLIRLKTHRPLIELTYRDLRVRFVQTF